MSEHVPVVTALAELALVHNILGGGLIRSSCGNHLFTVLVLVIAPPVFVTRVITRLITLPADHENGDEDEQYDDSDIRHDG